MHNALPTSGKTIDREVKPYRLTQRMGIESFIMIGLLFTQNEV